MGMCYIHARDVIETLYFFSYIYENVLHLFSDFHPVSNRPNSVVSPILG
jgi:hypothetical protein